MTNEQRLETWHKIVLEKNWEGLKELLDENVEFHSPFVWKPKEGKEVTAYILKSVTEVFSDFKYHREWLDNNDFALEFSASVSDKQIKGLDLIKWNDEGKIIHFEVLLRPANSLLLVGQKMTEKLQEGGWMS